MQVVVNYSFDAGQEVVCRNSGRRGTVIKQWSKLLKKSEKEYEIIKSYTVLPLVKSHNQFRVQEEDLISLNSDEPAF